MLQVSVVGQSRFRRIVNADLNVSECDFEFACKSCQGPQSAHSVIFGGSDLAQAQQGLPQLRGEQGRQRAAFWRFNTKCMNAYGLCIITDSIQKHCFAYAPQADQHGAFGWTADFDAGKGDPQGFAQFRPTG